MFTQMLTGGVPNPESVELDVEIKFR